MMVPTDPHDQHWFDEYEPESMPLAVEALGCIACLIAAPFVVIAVAWRGLTARWHA